MGASRPITTGGGDRVFFPFLQLENLILKQLDETIG